MDSGSAKVNLKACGAEVGGALDYGGVVVELGEPEC